MEPQFAADADTNTVPIRKAPLRSAASEPAQSTAVAECPPEAATAESSRRTNANLELDTPTPTVRRASERAAVPCPRCGAALTNPGSLGWCQKCGYCQSLDEEPVAVKMSQRRKPSTLGTFEILEMIQETPRWVWVLLGGVVVIALISLAANSFLDEDCLERALYTTIQIGIGLLMVIAAQIWAGVWVGVATEEEIGPKDFILPFRLWAITIGNLPRSRKPITLAAWAVAVMVFAVLLVGGLDFWWELYNPKRFTPPPSRNMAGLAQEDGDPNKSLEQTLKEAASYGEKLKDPEDKKKSKIDRRPTVPCVIIGYLLENDQLTGLVLARPRGERLVYAGVVRKGFEKDARAILKQLAALRQEEPYLAGLEIQAIWVSPQVVCEIHQSGTDSNGLLASPNYKQLVKK